MRIASRGLAVLVALTSIACNGNTASTDADAASDGFPTRDSDVFFDAIGGDASDAVSMDVVPPRWNCPPDWVPFARGGCGPAVLLCAEGGQAMAGACDALDVRRPHPSSGPDGGTPGVSFFVQPDGGLGGGWNAPRSDGDGGAECPPGWSHADESTCAPSLRTDCPLGTAALPDGTCTATGDDVCPAGAFADPGPEAMGRNVVHVVGDADPAVADGTETHPFATIAAAITAAGADGFVLVGSGTFAEQLVVDHAVHIVGACAPRTRIASNSIDSPSMHASGAVVVDVRGVSFGGASGAILVDGGAQLTLSNVRIDDATGFAILATGASTVVDARDLFVANTRFVVGGAPGVGVRVREGARFSGTRLGYVANHGGIAVRGSGSVATLSNAVVHGSLPRYDGAEPAGLGAYEGGRVDASYVVISGSRGYGIVSEQTGSSVALEDSVIADSVPLSDSAPGIGARARDGASITLVRTYVSNNRGAGISSVGSGTRFEVVDTSVTDTLPNLGGTRGFAIDVQGGAVVAQRALLRAATESAVFAIGGRVELHDVIVTGTRPSIRGLGFGLAAGSGTQMTASRIAITDVGGAAVAATNSAATLPAEGANVVIDDLFVRAVRESTVQLAPNDAPAGPMVGYGLAATAGSMLRGSYVVLADGPIGFYDRGAPLTLDTGVVTGQRAGSALATSAPTSMPMLYNIVFIGNENDGPVIDPTLPDPLSRP